MTAGEVGPLEGLPAPVATVLADFIAAACEAFASDLVSIVLFGSAAEGRLSPTSDVNILLVLRAFDAGRSDKLREAYRAAEAAIRLRAMYLLDSEVATASELFAQKFADIRRRRKVLLGPDPFAAASIPREAEIFRLRQVLLNLTLRLREACVGRGDRPEQVSRLLAEVLGPIRTACAALLELEGSPAVDTAAAFAAVAASFDETDLMARLLAAHDGMPLGSEAEADLVRTIAFLARVSARATRLGGAAA